MKGTILGSLYPVLNIGQQFTGFGDPAGAVKGISRSNLRRVQEASNEAIRCPMPKLPRLDSVGYELTSLPRCESRRGSTF